MLSYMYKEGALTRGQEGGQGTPSHTQASAAPLCTETCSGRGQWEGLLQVRGATDGEVRTPNMTCACGGGHT